MGFLGVYKAIYEYAPQSEGELQLAEGDVLYVLEKSTEDDWWKAKKKANAEDDEEPEGLIPNNYIEQVDPVGQARSLYEYTRQTDEELSFPEEAVLQVFDTTDEDWILVGYEGEYGFAPANYIELVEGGAEPASADAPPPVLPTRPPAPAAPEPEEDNVPASPPLPPRQVSFAEDATPPSPEPAAGPAAALAGVMAGRSAVRASPPSPIQTPARSAYASDDVEEEPSPALPNRPRHASVMSNDSSLASPPPRTSSRQFDESTRENQTGRIAPGGFHMYNINEMVSVMGKKKKMPTTLGVNLKTGIILIAPEHAQDGPTQEWTADKMTHYSREGKHVFLELVKPSKSIDFHAGAKDTAEEIVSALGELSGVVRAEGLREVIAAGHGQLQKKGVVLYDFMAQGDDEVTVAVGDDVIVLDDTKSEEWWLVRRVKNGKEGVVPSSYVEVTESIKSPATPTGPSSSTSGLNAGRSHVAQAREEERRLAREALKKEPTGDYSNERKRDDKQRTEGRQSKSKPDPSKVRSWTDRSKSFSVEAQFLGLKDGKINLHKMNGVKIAVPVAKMSVEDIEYVERVTGKSLDEDRPLSDVKRAVKGRSAAPSSSSRQQSKVGASIEPSKSDYDWFQFFLSCEVAVGLCERYAQAFHKDSMDESVLPDVDASVLRNLGLKEGDILKVMRYLDKKFGRDGKKKSTDDGENAGGLFSGPGGTLRNNTRRGRPEPATQTSDVVDPKAFNKGKDSADDSASSSPVNSKAASKGTGANGFDDDAWDVKPSKQPEQPAKPAQSSPEPKATATTPAPAPPPTQSIQDLNLLSQPLEPEKAPPPQISMQPQTAIQPQPTATLPQGANPSFFAGVAAQATGIQPMQTGTTSPAQPLGLGLGPRARPTPPAMTGAGVGMIAPPPARALSAPQSAQPSAFNLPPMQPQMTGSIAPPGQSMNEINQQRMMMMMQQQQAQQQQQNMGMFPQQTGMPFNPNMMPQPTGFGQPNQFMQPNMTGMPQMQMQNPSQFPQMQNQPTGFQGGFGQQQPGQQFPQQTGINSFLPQALIPEPTGAQQQQQQPIMQPMQAQPTGAGFGGFTRVNGNQTQSAAPLVPQQTGPAPNIRFGVPEKLAPQATGRRANLSAATPDNPFGF